MTFSILGKKHKVMCSIKVRQIAQEIEIDVCLPRQWGEEKKKKICQKK